MRDDGATLDGADATHYEHDRRPDVRDLRANVAPRRARDPVRPERRRLRRRLPALPGPGGRVRLAEGREPDDADGARRTSAPPADAVLDLRAEAEHERRDRGARADPPPPVRAGARHGRGGRPVQLEPVPANGRGNREEPGPAARVDRPALRG